VTQIIPADRTGPTGPRLPQTDDIDRLVQFAFPAPDRYSTMLHAYFDRAGMDAILLNGCANCREPANFSDYEKRAVHFYRPKEFMCHHCLDYDQTAQEYFTSHGLPLPNGIRPIYQSSH
jgi:hypothetical protein